MLCIDVSSHIFLLVRAKVASRALAKVKPGMALHMLTTALSGMEPRRPNDQVCGPGTRKYLLVAVSLAELLATSIDSASQRVLRRRQVDVVLVLAVRGEKISRSESIRWI